MTDKILIDSSVLASAYDSSEPVKQQSALALLERLVTANKGLISTQILSEFFILVTHKIPDPLTLDQAEARVANFCQIWPVLQINEMIILEAVRGVRAHSLFFWDALLWASARLNQIRTIFSDHFTHDQIIEGVRFFNPFPPP